VFAQQSEAPRSTRGTCSAATRRERSPASRKGTRTPTYLSTASPGDEYGRVAPKPRRMYMIRGAAAQEPCGSIAARPTGVRAAVVGPSRRVCEMRGRIRGSRMHTIPRVVAYYPGGRLPDPGCEQAARRPVEDHGRSEASDSPGRRRSRSRGGIGRPAAATTRSLLWTRGRSHTKKRPGAGSTSRPRAACVHVVRRAIPVRRVYVRRRPSDDDQSRRSRQTGRTLTAWGPF